MGDDKNIDSTSGLIISIDDQNINKFVHKLNNLLHKNALEADTTNSYTFDFGYENFCLNYVTNEKEYESKQVENTALKNSNSLSLPEFTHNQISKLSEPSEMQATNNIYLNFNEFVLQSTNPFDDLALKTVNDIEELRKIICVPESDVSSTVNTNISMDTSRSMDKDANNQSELESTMDILHETNSDIPSSSSATTYRKEDLNPAPKHSRLNLVQLLLDDITSDKSIHNDKDDKHYQQRRAHHIQQHHKKRHKNYNELHLVAAENNSHSTSTNNYNTNGLTKRSELLAMGFDSALVDAALEHFGPEGLDLKGFIDHLCSVSSLYEKDDAFSLGDCQKALFLNELDENKAFVFLQHLHKLYHYGFPILAIERALLLYDNDFERCLEHLLHENRPTR